MTTSNVPYALVVDDDPFILMGACDILETAGFRFFEAGDSDKAKTLLHEHADSVVLLFTDVDMPGSIDGFGLARYVAEHWPAIEIVVASGHALVEDGDMPAKATFIRKPFNENMVHSHLRKILPDGKMPDPLKRAI